jgi:hypothetical protein
VLHLFHRLTLANEASQRHYYHPVIIADNHPPRSPVRSKGDLASVVFTVAGVLVLPLLLLVLGAPFPAPGIDGRLDAVAASVARSYSHCSVVPVALALAETHMLLISIYLL